MTNLRLALLAAATFAASAAPALADTFTYTLDTQSVTVAPGGTYEFSGTLAAAPGDTGTYYPGDSFSAGGPITFDDSDFLATPYPLMGGDSYTGTLFSISAPAGTTPGAYSESFTVLFYTDPAGGTPAYTETQNFTVNVANGTSAVTPEPGSWMLLSTGLMGVGMLRRRFGAARA